MTKSYCSLQQSELVDVLDHEMSSFLFQCALSSLRNYNQRAFVGGSWSDSDEDEEENTKDEKCLMAKASNEQADPERHTAEDADINSVNDKQPLAEVQLTVQHDTLANEQQHYVQSEPIYDTHMLEKVDRNTIPDSTNICHRGGEIEQNAESSCTCPLLDPSF
ncbi:hypothetical protein Tco_0673618 [Tanacetum coccineum]